MPESHQSIFSASGKASQTQTNYLRYALGILLFARRNQLVAKLSTLIFSSVFSSFEQFEIFL
jgi:hypothetical protein